VPELEPRAIGILLAFIVGTGVVYSGVTTFRVFFVKLPDTPDWSDRFWYGVLPLTAYLLLSGATAAIWFVPAKAAHAIGGAAIFLLLVGIRDAWDLATFLVAMNKEPNR
jgi:hypothetical protein